MFISRRICECSFQDGYVSVYFKTDMQVFISRWICECLFQDGYVSVYFKTDM